MRFGLTALLVATVTVAGCGTLNTVAGGDVVTRQNLQKAHTYCESIPRVYSGVSYDFCLLNGAPSSGPGWATINSVPLVFLDFGFSGVLDTAALPYTIYRQSADGSISLRKVPSFQL